MIRTDVTPRQATVLTLMSDGHPTRVIAAHMGIRPQTVQDHKRALYQRLGIIASNPGPVAVGRWLRGEIGVTQ